MFWNRKTKCPVTVEDKEWIEKKLDWAHTNIINLKKQPTILPNAKYFEREFTGDEDDAHYILEVLSMYFQINPKNIYLDFYSEETQEFSSGLSTKRLSDSGSAGLYIQDGYKSSIKIEVQQLQQTQSLVATMAHELSHYIIMAEKGYFFQEPENELLTDLTAIAFGFGIFLGNSKFNFQQWSSGDGWGGWSASTKGYLPEQVIAYTMAEIQFRKGDLKPKWMDYLEGTFKKHFKKSLKYIGENK